MSRGSPEALPIARRPATHAVLRASILHWTTSTKPLTYICLACVVALVVTPFLWMLLGSFKPTYELLQQQGQTLWIAHPTLENYQRLFREYDFVRYFLNSLLVATVTAIVATSVSAFAGYSLARFQFPGRGFFGVLILVTQMLPGIAIIIPLFIWFKQFQLIDTYWALVIAYNAFAIPFSTWMLRGFFASIPRELEEAALIDGAGVVGAFLRIVVPLSLPGLLATAIFAFILSWHEFLFAVTFTNSAEIRTLTVGIAAMRGKDVVDWGLLNAGVVITTIPVAILFAFVQRFLVQGLTAGAVKG
jgi:ABC-type glycerol-3-phosphate transport system permease component